MRAGHETEFFRAFDACKQHEVLDRVFVGALRAGIADILKPLGLGRHFRQMLKLGGGQEPSAALVFGWGSAGHRLVHAASNAIKGAPASMMKNVEGLGVGAKLSINVHFEEDTSVWVFLDLANATGRSNESNHQP